MKGLLPRASRMPFEVSSGSETCVLGLYRIFFSFVLILTLTVL